MRPIAAFLMVLFLAGCGGYRGGPAARNSDAAPSAAGGGSYLHDGVYNGGAVDPDITMPRPGERP